MYPQIQTGWVSNFPFTYIYTMCVCFCCLQPLKLCGLVTGPHQIMTRLLSSEPSASVTEHVCVCVCVFVWRHVYGKFILSLFLNHMEIWEWNKGMGHVWCEVMLVNLFMCVCVCMWIAERSSFVTSRQPLPIVCVCLNEWFCLLSITVSCFFLECFAPN